LDQETFKVLFYPNPELRRKDIVETFNVTDEHRAIAQKMLATMYEHKGVGLAAPQVGLPLRLVVMDHDGKNPLILFNPFVLEWARSKVSMLEGCLSFPKLSKIIKRSPSVIVRYRTVDNIVKLETFEGLQARIIQHEIDHLNGILFVDR
jgi:peptide deformylase